MAESGAFKLLRHTHGEAIKALQEGRDARGAILECLALAPQVEPGLKKFYDKLEARREDFPALQRAAE